LIGLFAVWIAAFSTDGCSDCDTAAAHGFWCFVPAVLVPIAGWQIGIHLLPT
jgi:hypothetical protein